MRKELLMLITLLLVAMVAGACAKPTPAPVPTPAQTPVPTLTQTVAPTPKSTPTPTSAPATTLRIASHHPPTHLQYVEGVSWFAKRTEELSQGRVSFKLYPSETLGKEVDALKNAQTKVAELTVTSPQRISGDWLPLGSVLSLPGLVGSPKEAIAYLRLNQGILYDAEWSKVGVRPLVSIVQAAYEIASKKAIIEPEDLRGMKVRGPGGVADEAIKLLGATPVTVSGSEMYEALSRGVIDATINPLGSFKTYKINEMAKYMTVGLGFSNFGTNVVINEDVWRSLPKDVQQALVQAGEDATQHIGVALEGEAQTMAKEFRTQGITLNEVTPAQRDKWLKILSPTWQIWLKNMQGKGLDGQKIIDTYLSEAKKLSAK